jgi:replication-associated recombination protein RarA
MKTDYLLAELAKSAPYLEVIYQAGAHAIIFGERGVGKTSLANIINERIIGICSPLITAGRG